MFFDRRLPDIFITEQSWRLGEWNCWLDHRCLQVGLRAEEEAEQFLAFRVTDFLKAESLFFQIKDLTLICFLQDWLMPFCWEDWNVHWVVKQTNRRSLKVRLVAGKVCFDFELTISDDFLINGVVELTGVVSKVISFVTLELLMLGCWNRSPSVEWRVVDGLDWSRRRLGSRFKKSIWETWLLG